MSNFKRDCRLLLAKLKYSCGLQLADLKKQTFNICPYLIIKILHVDYRKVGEVKRKEEVTHNSRTLRQLPLTLK